ncbi:MAG TPA: hypothetical protein VHD56_12295 [Tepidisphaeraceae bacterium]|nr:hypothetical protein [Tepidisphaeraceae bacterium]
MLVFISSIAIQLRLELFTPTVSPSGEHGGWDRRVIINAGQLKYSSYGFLGFRDITSTPYGLGNKLSLDRRDRLGLDWLSIQLPTHHGRLEFSFPIWPATILFFACAWRLLRAANQLRRIRELNLCSHCGYDLRASVDRCPECGNPMEGKESEHDRGHPTS